MRHSSELSEAGKASCKKLQIHMREASFTQRCRLRMMCTGPEISQRGRPGGSQTVSW